MDGIMFYPALDYLLRYGYTELAQVPEQGYREYTGAALASLRAELIEVSSLVDSDFRADSPFLGIVQKIQRKKAARGPPANNGDF